VPRRLIRPIFALGISFVVASIAAGGASALSPDPYEPNESIAAATVLGSVPQVTLTNLTIDVAGDEDFFNVTAHSTGTLSVDLFFSNVSGDLDLQVQDSAANVLASSATTNDTEHATIPVVAGQHYYVRVFGASGAETNTYSVTLDNAAAPVPTSVILNPDDDSGISNSDNDTYPTASVGYKVNADLSSLADAGIPILTAAQAAGGVTAGASVQVFVNGVSVGFADVIGSSGNTEFSIGIDADLTTFPRATARRARSHGSGAAGRRS
jgi:hypothetical protein